MELEERVCQVVCEECNWTTEGTVPAKKPSHLFLESALSENVKRHHIDSKKGTGNIIGHQRFDVFLGDGNVAVIVGSSYFVHLIEDPSLPLYNWNS